MGQFQSDRDTCREILGASVTSLRLDAIVHVRCDDRDASTRSAPGTRQLAGRGLRKQDARGDMTTNIPGRRISYGETFYTEWLTRGGDCAFLRAQALIKSSATGSVYISLETRSEEDTSATAMDTYYPSSSPKLLNLDAVGVKTAIYLARTGSMTPSRGFKEHVRAKVEFNGGSTGDYYVLRIFPPAFFDNSIPAVS